MYRRWYTSLVSPGKGEDLEDEHCRLLGRNLKRVPAVFFKTANSNEPVRHWLKSKDLSNEDRKLVGEDVRTVEIGWPLGMPTCRPMGDGLHEVRTDLPNNRIARILFYIDGNGEMILLHGFIKKERKTPQSDLELARKRQKIHKGRRK